MKHSIHRAAAAALLILPAAFITRLATAQAEGSKPADPARPDPGITQIPEGYRDWRLISVAREEGKLDDIRAVLGNDIAIKAYREGTLPFPDGAVIARIAWALVPSEENDKAFGQAQSFVPGAPKNGVQFMFKDSKKYAASGGWGYAQFGEADGRPVVDEAKLAACFTCHQPAAAQDFIFTRYSLGGLAGQK
ncbi:cytochrome P460 family protein [Luteolibacter arcticus]|uniref:Cytochrome P460 family protein n=1 Tax=Luteolibacter arcticus TaxID=1581411 RepID=A0ABT3GGV4_9BACT|nr:cytochrome P460 family protein [Luteolibacter arcticus]MCW1922837.1 cytochrome P460 family protein [Luteolibacter arcticus]